MVHKANGSYRLEEQGGFLVVIALEASHCPVCRTELMMRSRRQRVMWDGDTDAAKSILLIRRLYCEKCKRIHHELPDCIVPYKRYSTAVIEKIVAGQDKKDAPCPESTVRRLQAWWAVVKIYFLHIMEALKEKYGVSFGNPPTFREAVRAAVNSNRWIFAHQLCTRSASRPG